MNSLLDRTRQALWLVWRWLPTRELVVVGDRAYAAIEWLDAVRQVGYVITRLRLDAALYEPAPQASRDRTGARTRSARGCRPWRRP